MSLRSRLVRIERLAGIIRIAPDCGEFFIPDDPRATTALRGKSAALRGNFIDPWIQRRNKWLKKHSAEALISEIAGSCMCRNSRLMA